MEPRWMMFAAKHPGKLTSHSVEVGVRTNGLDASHGIDMSLHEVSAQTAVGPHRPLEVDEAAGPQATQRRDAQCLGTDVRMNAGGVPDVTVRQTPLTARLSPSESSRRQRCRETHPDAAAGRDRFDDFTNRFNEAREHTLRLTHQVRSARRVAAPEPQAEAAVP